MHEVENTSTILKKTAMLIASDQVRNLSLLLVASIGWYFLYRRTATAEQNTEAAQQSAQAAIKNTTIAEQGLTTERLTRAIEQLAHKRASIRLGGILGLQQIASHHEEEHEKIVQILSAFVRDFAPKDSDTRIIEENNKYLDIREAVELLAAITESFSTDKKEMLCDLRFTNLSGLAFADTNLSYFNFLGANFSNSFLWWVDFTGSRLGKVNFSGTSFRNPKGLTQEQLEQAFYWRGHPPINFPGELELTEIDPNEQGVGGNDDRNG